MASQYGGFSNPYAGLAAGITSAGENIATAITEARKAKQEAAGGHLIADQALQTGAIDLPTYTKFMKSSPSAQNAMIGSFIRLDAMKREQESSRRAEEQLRLGQQASRLDIRRYNQQLAESQWQPSDEARQQGYASDLQYVPTGPGKFSLQPFAHPDWVPSPQDQAEAAQMGGRYIRTNTGYQFERSPAPQAPTVPVQIPGQQPLNVPATSELGQQEISSLNPARHIWQTYGLTPDDYLQHDPSVQVGSYDKRTGFDPSSTDWTHIKIKGQLIPMSEYQATVNKLVAAGQTGTKPVTLPSGQVIQPQAQTAQTAAAGPAAPQPPGQRKLDPTNPSDMALVHTLLDKNNGDIDAAKAEAAQMGLTWL